ncbi:PSB7 protein, partial [Polypterus senegalus]
CCGAGTAADTEKTTDMLSSNLQLQSLSLGRNPRLIMACRILQDMLFRYRGQISAMLVLGGVDCTGPHIFTVSPFGSVLKLPFATMGSGDLPALSVFEDRFKPNMSVINPEVFLTHKRTDSGMEATCYVTGFFPRDIEVIWHNGGDDDLDFESGEVLPNEDGTYQAKKDIKTERKARRT